MPETKFNERRLDDVEYAQRVADLKEFSIGKFDESAARMGILEAAQEKHLGILMQNTTMTKDMHERFNVLENGIKGNERALAEALEEWKTFSILKFDESSARQVSIEGKQAEHMGILCANTQALAALQGGIGDVLEVVTALKGTKKTLGWIRKFVIWLASLATAGGVLWTAVRTALSSGSKIQWPWL